MRRLLPLVLVLLAFVPARVDALTIRDIVELSKAGLGEDVLLALIEVDPSVFAIDAGTLKMLKEAGVSQKVIVAMIRSGRTPPPEPVNPPAPDPPPPADPRPVVVIDHHDDAPTREVMVPVYVPVYPSYPTRRVYHILPDVPTSSTPTRFIPTTGLGAPPRTPTTQPEFWGNGGRLRPDAWGQPRPDTWKTESRPDRPADPRGDPKKDPKK